jgi:hypothetical protein
MYVGDQVVTFIARPLKTIVLLPWVLPKLTPETWIVAPTAPLTGDTLEIAGVGRTLKAAKLLSNPPT